MHFLGLSGGGDEQGERLPGLGHPRGHLPPPTALLFKPDSNPAGASADQLALGQVLLPETLPGLFCDTGVTVTPPVGDGEGLDWLQPPAGMW